MRAAASNTRLLLHIALLPPHQPRILTRQSLIYLRRSATTAATSAKMSSVSASGSAAPAPGSGAASAEPKAGGSSTLAPPSAGGENGGSGGVSSAPSSPGALGKIRKRLSMLGRSPGKEKDKDRKEKDEKRKSTVGASAGTGAGAGAGAAAEPSVADKAQAGAEKVADKAMAGADKVAEAITTSQDEARAPAPAAKDSAAAAGAAGSKDAKSAAKEAKTAAKDAKADAKDALKGKNSASSVTPSTKTDKLPAPPAEEAEQAQAKEAEKSEPAAATATTATAAPAAAAAETGVAKAEEPAAKAEEPAAAPAVLAAFSTPSAAEPATVEPRSSGAADASAPAAAAAPTSTEGGDASSGGAPALPEKGHAQGASSGSTSAAAAPIVLGTAVPTTAMSRENASKRAGAVTSGPVDASIPAQAPAVPAKDASTGFFSRSKSGSKKPAAAAAAAAGAAGAGVAAAAGATAATAAEPAARPSLLSTDKSMPDYTEGARSLLAEKETLRQLYPAIEPYESGRLRVDETHELYWEWVGKQEGGVPVVFLHGGPGGGVGPSDRRWFDPAHYRVLLFDQRGAGKSTPPAELKNNTTWDLVADIERLRTKFGIDKWIVFGGSWGSTLSLAYAQKHPERVAALVLRGIFTLRKSELQFFYQDGASHLFPEMWKPYRDHIVPERERSDFIKAYYKRLTSKDPATRLEAARRWSTWENATSKLYVDAEAIARGDDDTWALQFARIESHFFINAGWMKDGQLLEPKNLDRIRDIPAVIVQGRYDVVCPATTAWTLHERWPQAKFHLVPDAGHSASQPGIRHHLLEALEEFKSIKA